MTENMKAFVEQSEKDGLLKAELEAMSKEYSEYNERALDLKEAITQKITAIAAKYGFTLTAEDFKQDTEELTPDQLDAVTGGERICECACWFVGAGGDFKDKMGACICLAGGYGGSDDGSGTRTPMMRCACPVVGAGWD